MTQTDKPSVAEIPVGEKNIVIAEFMGTRRLNGRVEVSERRYSLLISKYPHQLKYHFQIDWLYPVYKKIMIGYYKAYEGNKNQEEMKRLFANVQAALLSGIIGHLHQSIYDFILWYNQHHNRP